ncbi:MAG: beta-lactamase family protein [Flavobacteriaceae bacterium]|nr:beta-lactamase family protein [Flavobacteriaceae bacterium]
MKYSIGICIVVLSNFLLSTTDSLSADVVGATINTPTTLVKDATTVKGSVDTIATYSNTRTKLVRNKLDSLLKRIHKRHDFHGSILVAHKNKIVYNNQIGYADFRKKKRLTNNSIYQLASVSKQFTAAAIMLLKEQNKLKLTDTINQYFPKFPFKNITIKHLLNHTSGLPNYFWIAENEWDKNAVPTNAEMMDFFESTSVSKFFRPGRNFDYSNTGYFVLASIIEKIANTSYASFLKENIFNPLQMNNSFVFSHTKDTVRTNQLIGYRLYRGWRHRTIPNTINDGIVGDKNIYVTQKDMFKWITGLQSGKLLSKESVTDMFTEGKTKYGRKVPYGFGFRIKNKNDEKIVYHFGKWNGFSTGISLYPEDLVIIILEHTSYRAMGSLTKKIRDLVNTHFEFTHK